MSLHLAKEQAIAEHRKMWNWIADETEKKKRKITEHDYFKTHSIVSANRPFGECYACEYGAELTDSDLFQDICRLCPLDWGGRADDCMCINVFCYGEWFYTNNWKEAAELARRIAEVPESNEEQEDIYL